MKKFTMVMGLSLLSMAGFAFAVQTLTVPCANGSVEVSNVPDSMTVSDLNADYRCPRNGGVWAVSTGDTTDLTGNVTTTVDTEVDAGSTGVVVEGEVTSSVSIERSASGLVAVHLQDAIDYLFANGLTMYGTEETFMGSSSLRRDEAAAFFARFARDVLGMEVSANAECAFSDLAGAHQDLLGEINAACQLGLFK